MKTKLSLGILLILALSPVPSALCQIPQGFNYQAIARLTTGDPIINTTLPVRITIQADSLGTAIIWQELHNSVTTNGFGLLTLVIGKGARQAASTVATFSAIDWTVVPKFIKTEIDYSGWKTMGVTRFWSVPYAKTAENLGGPLKKLAVTGTTLVNDEALFEVKNRDGNTVFAVYNEGVRVYVADGAKGLKGGFAVGGFGTDKAESQKYMVVSKDSVRIYLDTNPLTKGLKGGFAVGGYDLTKAIPQEYLRVTQDSTRINVNNNPVKGLKGGFAVGGFDVVKGTPTPFTSLTPKNYFIGHEGGLKITSGQFNSVVGYQSGKFITTGQSNAFLGYQSGYNDNTGTGNLFLGYQTGYSTTGGSYNSFVGYKGGYSNTSGLNNSFVGSFAGYSNTIGNYNTFVGDSVGYKNGNGSQNSFYGDKAGLNNTVGNRNVFLGQASGYGNILGNDNVCIGTVSGYNSTAGASNIYIGFRSGSMFSTGSRNICIGTEAGWQSYAQANVTSDNIFIGYQSGNPGAGSEYMNSPGNGNIWIGKYAGWNLGSQWYNAYMKDATPPIPPLMNTLVIDNSDHGTYIAPPPTGPDLTHYPLIFGNFSYEVYRRCVVINGVNNHGYTFFVNGSSASYGAWGVSDEREKKNIKTISGALNKVLSLRGVNFEWRDTVRMDKGQQLGFIAQEAVKIVPEAVQYRNDYYTMNYSSLSALLVEGMKEQQKQIEEQNKKIISQQQQIDRLTWLVEEMESRIASSSRQEL